MNSYECNAKLTEWNKLGKLPHIGKIGSGQHCAYDPQARNDSCQGDNGGP